MFPFDRPSNYNEMLNKIGIFTFLEAVVLAWLVAHFVLPVSAPMAALKLPVKVWSIEIPLLYVGPGILIALFARIIRLHDKISCVFRVRRTFDIYRVLIPLAGAVGCVVSPAQRKMLQDNRKRAMQKTFYAYASFEDPKISKALVLSAIDIWTWYWILAELLFLLVLAAGVFLSVGAYGPAAYILLMISALIILFCSVFAVCGAKADHQIDEIVSDQGRAEVLKQEFRSLLQTN